MISLNCEINADGSAQTLGFGSRRNLGACGVAGDRPCEIPTRIGETQWPKNKLNGSVIGVGDWKMAGDNFVGLPVP